MSLPSLKTIKKRSLVMMIIVLVCLAILALRVAYWQIVRGNEMSERAKNQQQGNGVVSSLRGNIYDRNGKTLAESASVNTLICNPQDMKENGNATLAAKELSGIIGMEYDEIYNLFTVKDSRYQVIKKRLSIEENEKIKAIIDPKITEDMSLTEKKELKDHKQQFSGIYFENDSKRYYPFEIAPHILGFTGYDNNGLQGIELTFDNELSGKNSTVAEEDPEGAGAEKGEDIVLTIDETIQHYLETKLEEAVSTDKLKEGAAGIIMNPKTGEILAMATKPDFDANNPYNVDKFAKYAVNFSADAATTTNSSATPAPTDKPGSLSDKTIAAMRNKMWRNKAVSDTYEPGSTFKIITAAAALEEHVVDDNSKFYCPGFRVVEDRKINCAAEDGHGSETFEEGVRNSCNPVFIDIGLKLGADKFMEYFNAFGLTEKTGVQLGGESSSIYYRTKMNRVDLATSAFGQGFQITPLQLVTAVSAVVNGGQRMKPLLVKEIRNSAGVVKSYEPEAINRVISQETSDKMREILESVVSQQGATGRNAYVKGCRIGGKTGTSEKMPRGSDKRIASFVGFAPANDPEIVCLIMLDEPQVDNKYGGTIAAPVTGEIIEETLNYLGVEKQYTKDEVADKKVEVADVRDLDINKAKSEITASGMNVEVKGSGSKVIDQLPKPGVMMNSHSLVILYTENVKGDNTVTVPSLDNLSVDEAEYTLQAHDLNFEITGAGHSEAKTAYSVAQSIKAGEKVTPGTVVGVEFRQAASD